MSEEELKNQEDKNQEGENQDAKCLSCDEYLIGWKRALADYDNLKKDLSRERTESRQSAVVGVALQLLPVLDNFDAATRFAPEGLDAKTQGWLSGVLHIRSQLERVMIEMGLEPFGATGDAFDPNLHDAAGERAQEGAVAGVILEIVLRGWNLSGRVVRPARVVVAK